MANLKEIRTRIASVKSTRQITSAMKMVSAAKLKKAQDTVINLRPYAKKLKQILFHINKSTDPEKESQYARKKETGEVLIVSVTSNKGLCGAFNANIIKKVIDLITEDYRDLYNKGKVSIYSIGKKGTDFYKKNEYNLSDFDNDLLDQLSFTEVVSLAEDIMQKFAEKKLDKVILVYNRFKNAAVQVLTTEQFLPLEMPDKEESIEFDDYIFEPNKSYIITELIPKYLKLKFYEAILESMAAEHGARMTAMHKATDNATTLIKELQLKYNKARQASITNEILEIVGGAEALNK